MRISTFCLSHSLVRSILIICACFIGLLLPRGTALAVHDSDLFEFDGNILSDGGVDWNSIFVVDDCSGQDGEVIGTSLPPEGIIAAFVRDQLSVKGLIDCTTFGPTSNKNGDAVNTWDWRPGNVPAKDDLANVYAYLVEDPVSGRRLLYMGLERIVNDGDSHIDFDVKLDPTFGLDGTADCETSGRFTGEHLDGDLLVALDFEKGGALALVRIFRYEGTPAVLNATPIAEASTGTPFCNTAGLPADSICGTSNAASIPGGCWLNFGKGGNTTDMLLANAFTEVGIDLNSAGISGERCISTVIAKSRSSQSITSELKDFAILKFDTCSDICGTKLEVDGVLGDAEPDCDLVVGPLAGWEIRLLDADGNLVTTDGNGEPLENPVCTNEFGEYCFLDLPNGHEFTVCEVLPDTTPEDDFNWDNCLPGGGGAFGDSIDLGACDSDTDGGVELCYADPITLDENTVRDFRNFKRFKMATIAGTKFCDENGDGLFQAGEEGLGGFCILLKQEGVQVDQAVTASDGTYEFQDIPCGYTYTMEEDLSGLSCGSDDKSDVWVATSGAHTVDLTACPDLLVFVGDRNFGNTSKPTIDCGTEDGDDVTRNNDPGLCTANYCFKPVADNLCGNVSVNCVASGGVVLTGPDENGLVCGDFPAACAPGATTTVTCTATTDAGLTDTCSFTVTVIDNEPPKITCPPGFSVQCVGDVPPCNPDNATASDNCGPVVVTCDQGPLVGGPCGGTVTNTYTAIDNCGLTATCTQVITVNDTILPEITCPDDFSVQCVGDVPPCNPDDAKATDNCGPVVVTCVQGPLVGGACGGTVTNTYTATDECGNTDTCTQVITVNDTIAPEITCPADFTVECLGDVPPCNPADATATDNCDDLVEITCVQGPLVGGPCGGTVTNTYTASDDCGNKDICTQVITVNDTTPPVITNCPSDAIIACGDVFEVTLMADDNCDPNPVFVCEFSDDFDPDRFTVTELGNGSFQLILQATTVVTVTCTAADICGNTSEVCMFTVSATCNQACSPGFWKNPVHFDRWCEAGLNPTDNYCGPALPATKFTDAFGITDLSSPEIPGDFNPDMTLLEAVNSSGGTFNQTLFHGSAALLSASHPEVSFPSAPGGVKTTMQQAFAGTISFAEAFATFKALNDAEQEGGCPID